jgi:hypothetical protein
MCTGQVIGGKGRWGHVGSMGGGEGDSGMICFVSYVVRVICMCIGILCVCECM